MITTLQICEVSSNLDTFQIPGQSIGTAERLLNCADNLLIYFCTRLLLKNSLEFEKKEIRASWTSRGTSHVY